MIEILGNLVDAPNEFRGKPLRGRTDAPNGPRSPTARAPSRRVGGQSLLSTRNSARRSVLPFMLIRSLDYKSRGRRTRTANVYSAITIANRSPEGDTARRDASIVSSAATARQRLRPRRHARSESAAGRRRRPSGVHAWSPFGLSVGAVVSRRVVSESPPSRWSVTEESGPTRTKLTAGCPGTG